MPAPPKPASTRLRGNENWVLVTAIADINSPKLAEMTAATNYDITDITLADGSTWPTGTTASVERNRRFGDETVFQTAGDESYGEVTIIYVHNPQAMTGTTDRKLYEKIPKGAKMFLVNRQGLAKTADFATAQRLTAIYPVEFGRSHPARVGDGPSMEAAQQATVFVTDEPAYDKAIVAS